MIDRLRRWWYWESPDWLMRLAGLPSRLRRALWKWQNPLGTICQQAGCTNQGSPYWYSDHDSSEPDEWFCSRHAGKHGFCRGCGLFWAGTEAFDFEPRELCGNCRRQLPGGSRPGCCEGSGRLWP